MDTTDEVVMDFTNALKSVKLSNSINHDDLYYEVGEHDVKLLPDEKILINKEIEEEKPVNPENQEKRLKIMIIMNIKVIKNLQIS